VFASLAVAVGVSGAALWLVGRPKLDTVALLGGGTAFGVGIAAMHYIGMAAMRLEGVAVYEPGLVVLSVLVAVGTAWAALWLAFRFRAEEEETALGNAAKLGAAVVLGLAIAGMHYTAMAAVEFRPLGSTTAEAVKPSMLAAGVAIATLVILSLALVATYLEQRFNVQKARAEASREGEDRFRSLAEAIPQIVWTTDPEGNHDYFNRRWFEYTGQSFESSRDWGWHGVVHPDDSEECLRRWTHSLGTGEPYEVEYRFRRGADGAWRWFLGRATPVRDKSGRIVKWFGTCTDIDDQRRAIDQLSQSEERYRNRAVELARLTRQLKHTATSLERRNRELDQFAYVASHDLKAPLRAIANLSEWIEEDLDGQLPPDAAHKMQLLRGRVHRMEGLINGLLQYSRAGRTAEAEELVDTAALVGEVVDSLSPQLGFTVEVRPPMPHLVCERLLLGQVFSNLISNAIKHHDRPEGWIVVSARDLGESWEFSVADDGPGIAPAYHEKVFAIFQTLQPRDRVESTGIGLALVKKIVEGRGGTVGLESAGRGSTFRFSWPKGEPLTSEVKEANGARRDQLSAGR